MQCCPLCSSISHPAVCISTVHFSRICGEFNKYFRLFTRYLLNTGMRRSIQDTLSAPGHPNRKMVEGERYMINSPQDTSISLRRLYPSVHERDNDISLPRRWDLSQASSYLEISRNGLTVSFKKNAVLEDDKDPSGVVRADSPIPSSVGLYYFEIKIVHGHRGCMGVGLSKAGGELNRMPGWDPFCYGYHGDDGNFFYSCGTGTLYGPKFGTGDVIGCGMDTLLNHVFFTKNGKHLGVAYQGTEPFGELYPTVGLKTPGEQLHVNFGGKPFMFDFENYCKISNRNKMVVVEKTQMPENIGNKMDRVVSSFLGHSGSFGSLRLFKTICHQGEVQDSFLEHRKEIVDMIMKATYGAVIQEKIEEHFPGCLEQDSRVQLVLYCLRYIDLANTLLEPPSSFRNTQSDNGQPLSPTELRPRMSKHSKRNRQNYQNPQSLQPKTKKTAAKIISESCLDNPTIVERFTDVDTGEEMIRTECLTVTKNMFIDLHASEQYEKMSYMMKMGREIMKLSHTVNLTARERQIVELSMTMVLTTRRLEKHPLSSAQRRYIANLVTSMINGSHNRTSDDSRESSENHHERKVYSEVRGMFIGWKGLHVEAALKDHPAAAVSFMKTMVVNPENCDGEFECTEEPMEENNTHT